MWWSSCCRNGGVGTDPQEMQVGVSNVAIDSNIAHCSKNDATHTSTIDFSTDLHVGDNEITMPYHESVLSDVDRKENDGYVSEIYAKERDDHVSSIGQKDFSNPAMKQYEP